uniref:Uncharacterized protein n=1 Tax=Lygus hesperus TaxID=30085 RepID=A0A146MCG7_LYGHE
MCEIGSNGKLRKVAVIHSCVPSTTTTAVTIINTFDVNGDDKDELLIGYEDGSCCVYTLLSHETLISATSMRTNKAIDDINNNSNKEGSNVASNTSVSAEEGVSGIETNNNSNKRASGALTWLFVLLWQGKIGEMAVRIVAGNVTSSCKTQPNMLVQGSSGKVLNFTVQAQISQQFSIGSTQFYEAL